MGITLSLVVYPATISTNLLMTSSRIMMTSSNLLMTSSGLLMTSSGSCLLIRALVTYVTNQPRHQPHDWRASPRAQRVSLLAQ